MALVVGRFWEIVRNEKRDQIQTSMKRRQANFKQNIKRKYKILLGPHKNILKFCCHSSIVKPCGNGTGVDVIKLFQRKNYSASGGKIFSSVKWILSNFCSGILSAGSKNFMLQNYSRNTSKIQNLAAKSQKELLVFFNEINFEQKIKKTSIKKKQKHIFIYKFLKMF